MKRLFFLILFSLCLFTYSQSNNLRGRILDSKNFPLPGAIVKIESEDLYATSDFDGYFLIQNLKEGSFTINISYVGYEDLTDEVSIPLSNNNGQPIYILETRVNKLDEVVVSGFQSGNLKALNKQRNDINVTNVVSADQIGKFPDANIGDALKRIPGISMQNDQGEARDIVIRGFSPGLNSVTLNGERIPSAEGDNRRIQMDLIPSDMIQLIEVNKTLTPDMEADAIGGSVNLVTRSNPNGFRFSSTISGGTNPIRDGGYNRNFSLIVADKLSNKFAYTFSAVNHSSDYGSDNVEFEWNDPSDSGSRIGEMDIRRYDVKRTRRSLALNLDYNINNTNKLYLKSLYNSRDDWENRYRLRIARIEEDNVRVRKQTKGGINNDRNENTRLEDQRVYKFALGGDHLLGKLSMDWKYSYSKASEERPDERYIRFEQTNVPISNIDISSPRYPNVLFSGNSWNNPSAYEFDEAQGADKYTEEDNHSFRLNFELPYNKNDYLKFGYKLNSKSKLRDDIWYEYDVNANTMADATTEDVTIENYLPGEKYKHGLFATSEYLGSLPFNSSTIGDLVMDEFATSNYTADENVNAAYLMISDQLGENSKVILGARLENTDINYTGFAFDEDNDEILSDLETLEGSKNYTNILPNINFQTKFGNNFVLNAAYTNGIARPAYFELVPYEVIVPDDQEIAQGNPDLEAVVSNNLDLIGEYYFSGLGIVSIGLFNKNIDNWLYTFSDDNYIYNGEDGWDYQQVRNGRKATVNGVEFNLQTKLIKNLTFFGNYTYTDSNTDGIEGRPDAPLAGAVENMFNASLAYESNKFFVRVSTNYSGEAVDELGGDAWEDRYYDQQFFLDANAAYTVNDKIRIFTEFKNITNQPLRYYQGAAHRTMQLEYYNFNWNIGVKIDL